MILQTSMYVKQNWSFSRNTTWECIDILVTYVLETLDNKSGIAVNGKRIIPD